MKSTDIINFLLSSEVVLCCLVDTEGVVRGASSALTTLLGRDPLGSPFTDIQSSGTAASLSQGIGELELSLLDSYGGHVRVRFSMHPHGEGHLLAGAGIMLSHSTLLEEKAKLENELTRTNRELQKHIRELERARDEIKTLSGMLPICMHCKNIRDDKGYWSRVESYISRNADVSFSHGICPDCLAKYFPEFPEDE